MVESLHSFVQVDPLDAMNNKMHHPLQDIPDDNDSGVLILPSDSASLSVPESLPSDLTLDLPPNAIVFQAKLLTNGRRVIEDEDDSKKGELWDTSTTHVSTTSVISVKITPRRLWMLASIVLMAIVASVAGVAALIRDRNHLQKTVQEFHQHEQAKYRELQAQLDKLKLQHQQKAPPRFPWQDQDGDNVTTFMNNCWAKIQSGSCAQEAKETLTKYWSKFKHKVADSYETLKHDIHQVKEQYQQEARKRGSNASAPGTNKKTVVVTKATPEQQPPQQQTDSLQVAGQVLTGVAVAAVGGLLVGTLGMLMDADTGNDNDKSDSVDPLQFIRDAF